MRIGLPLLGSACLLMLGCAGSEPVVANAKNETREAPAAASFAGLWAADCEVGGMYARLNADGTYTEVGGRGRWRLEGDHLRVEVAAEPTVTFESRYPELLSLDADGRLTIIGPDELEAKSGGLKKRFRRCPR